MPARPQLAVGVLVAAGLAAALLGCGSGTSAAIVTPGPLVASPPVVSGCESVGSSEGVPTSDPRGPFFDQLGTAASEDGVSASGYREVLPHASAPDGVQLPDGTWLMAFSRQQHTGIGLARSSDGLSFTQFDAKDFGVVPELALTDDGRVRLYVCANGVESYVSADRGATWSRERQVIRAKVTGRAIVCDPSYVPAARLFIFKVTDA